MLLAFFYIQMTGICNRTTNNYLLDRNYGFYVIGVCRGFGQLYGINLITYNVNNNK